MKDTLEARAKLAISTAIVGYRHEYDGSDSPGITWESLRAGELAVLDFAESIRAEATLAEREACAKVANAVAESWRPFADASEVEVCEEIAAAIRARTAPQPIERFEDGARERMEK